MPEKRPNEAPQDLSRYESYVAQVIRGRIPASDAEEVISDVLARVEAHQPVPESARELRMLVSAMTKRCIADYNRRGQR